MYSICKQVADLGVTTEVCLKALDELLPRFVDTTDMEDLVAALRATLLGTPQVNNTYEVEVGFAEMPHVETVAVVAASATEARRAALDEAYDHWDSQLVGVVYLRIMDDDSDDNASDH